MERNLVALMEVPLDCLGALETELLVDVGIPGRVGVSLDLNVNVPRTIALEPLRQTVDLHLRRVRKVRLTEPEVALLLGSERPRTATA